MKLSKYPAPVVDRYVVVTDEHAPACARALALRTARVAELRRIGGGDFPRSGVPGKDLAHQRWAEAEVPAALKQEQAASKISADAARAAASVKAFVDTEAEVELVGVPESNGQDLDSVRGSKAAVYAELARIKALHVGSDRSGVAAWLEPGFRAAEAELDQLVGRHPHSLNEPVRRDTLIALQIVRTPRDAMVDHYCGLIDAQANAVIPPSERPARIAELEARLLPLHALDAHFVFEAIADGRTDISFDPMTPPHAILGVRLVGTNAEKMKLAS
jgi:hypothetical protein